jgi:hypothetical protein
MDLTKHLLDTASAYAKERGISMARLSTLVMNDGKFFDRVGSGKTLTVRTYEKVTAWFVKQGHPVEPICIPNGAKTRKLPKGFRLQSGDRVYRIVENRWEGYIA